jgi:twitching motility protein PilJ
MTAPATPAQKSRGLDLLIVVAALLALGSAGAWFIVRQGASQPKATTAPVEELNTIAIDAQGAAAGDEAALTNLQKEVETLRRTSREHDEAAWAQDPKFSRVVNNATIVLQARQSLADAASAARDSRELVPKLLAEIGTLASNLNGPSLEAAVRPLERFEVRAQRLQLDVASLATGAANPSQAAQRLAESQDYMQQVIRGFQGSDTGLGLPKATGADAQQRLKAVDGLYNQLAAVVKSAINAAPALPAAQTAARSVSEDARSLATTAGRGGFDSAQVGQNPLDYLPLVLAIAAAAVVLLVWLGIKRMRDTVERYRLTMESQRKDSDRNQQAILRLLDELSSLADGDLTVQATVTEDITGAIADSINYAVDALRGLVTTINQSAIHLDSAARQTQALSAHLAKASGAQSKQISSATESAGGMASATEEVSGNAERAADVARHSVEVAHKGGDAVRRTIDGMNTIRETIQETSKRIKRLGESSQEIGNIVELINDIAEQTNILALNASIQASMAGEAGRGFAVVADEVQRLAERAANATKQIEVLVRTIQTDTNEAVVSMERSTTDVVGGALLAENAGAALEEIEQVSNQIASLVQNISSSSRQQTSAAQNIARNMGVLKEISTQTTDSTNATSAAIAKLAELSSGLRKSAAGFRLPGAPSEPAQSTSTSQTGTFRRVEDGKAAPVRPVSVAGGS